MKSETKTGTGQPVSQGNKGRLLIIAAVALLALAVAGGGAAFMVLSSHTGSPAGSGHAAKSGGKKTAPAYAIIDTFTVNLAPEDSGEYLQAAVSVELEQASAEEELKAYMPKLRSRVTLLLASKTSSELASSEGKERLAEELRHQLNAVLEPDTEGEDGPIREVLFTSFIIQ